MSCDTELGPSITSDFSSEERDYLFKITYHLSGTTDPKNIKNGYTLVKIVKKIAMPECDFAETRAEISPEACWLELSRFFHSTFANAGHFLFTPPFSAGECAKKSESLCLALKIMCACVELQRGVRPAVFNSACAFDGHSGTAICFRELVRSLFKNALICLPASPVLLDRDQKALYFSRMAAVLAERNQAIAKCIGSDIAREKVEKCLASGKENVPPALGAISARPDEALCANELRRLQCALHTLKTQYDTLKSQAKQTAAKYTQSLSAMGILEKERIELRKAHDAAIDSKRFVDQQLRGREEQNTILESAIRESESRNATLEAEITRLKSELSIAKSTRDKKVNQSETQNEVAKQTSEKETHYLLRSATLEGENRILKELNAKLEAKQAQIDGLISKKFESQKIEIQKQNKELRERIEGLNLKLTAKDESRKERRQTFGGIFKRKSKEKSSSSAAKSNSGEALRSNRRFTLNALDNVLSEKKSNSSDSLERNFECFLNENGARDHIANPFDPAPPSQSRLL